MCVTNIVFDTNPDDYMSLRVVGQRALLKILNGSKNGGLTPTQTIPTQRWYVIVSNVWI